MRLDELTLFAHVSLTDKQIDILQRMYADSRPGLPITMVLPEGETYTVDYEVLAAYGLLIKERYPLPVYGDVPALAFTLSLAGGMLLTQAQFTASGSSNEN